jgi:DNA-binding response OmpR family regulator
MWAEPTAAPNGSNYEGDPSVVAVYMRRLRERIERNPSAPDHLKTVWGIGYKFEL